jgi:hypothetical protein
MTFSQAWDAGFKAILIYVGVVFGWLIFIERLFENQSVSVAVMNVVAAICAVAFFVRRRRYCIAERRAAEAEVASILAEI